MGIALSTIGGLPLLVMLVVSINVNLTFEVNNMIKVALMVCLMVGTALPGWSGLTGFWYQEGRRL